MRYGAIVIAAVLMIAAAVPAYARGGDRLRGDVKIEIISEGSGTFQSIPYNDFWEGRTHIVKRYLEARRGETYSIVINNMTPGRIGVVIAVDGRNIISGKRSDLKNNEAMYIVNGGDCGEYDGWRTASDKVNRFYFTDMTDSYAMRTFNDSTAMGVIAVAVYREKERPQTLYEQKRPDNIHGAPSPERALKGSMGAAREESAGTGFGTEQYSPTIRVAFEPENSPAQKTLLKYEWREILCSKGIMNCRGETRNRFWDEEEYAPYPPGYMRN